jgi:predicted DNA-binding transcriptional regulator YafY
MVRLLGMLKLFAEGARPTVYDLAARYHVRRETVYRDLHALEDAGFPIAGDDAGRLSRPRFEPGTQAALPPVALTHQELAGLVWAARHTEPRQAFWGALTTALAKLQTYAPRRESGIALALDGALGSYHRAARWMPRTRRWLMRELGVFLCWRWQGSAPSERSGFDFLKCHR